MTKIRRIDFSPDEWIAGTIGMSLEEEGLYMRICTLIYSRGGPIEVVQLHRVGLHGNKLNALLERLLSMGKIERNGGEIDQKRCRIELETARIRLRKASENGTLGNKIKRLKHATRDGVASANHQPSTINHQEDPPKPPLRGGASRPAGSMRRRKGEGFGPVTQLYQAAAEALDDYNREHGGDSGDQPARPLLARE